MFRLDSPFMRLMARLFDLILLNILFLLCCIPVVTIGASCTALHTVSLKYAAGDEPPVMSTFFGAFRANFVSSTLSWLLFFIAGAFLYVDTSLATQTQAGGLPVQFLLTAASILLFGVSLYLFPLQARYQNTLRANYRNALLLAIRHLPRTALLALTVLVPLGLLLYGSTETFLLLGILMLLMGASVIAGIQAKILLPIFRQHEETGSADHTH